MVSRRSMFVRLLALALAGLLTLAAAGCSIGPLNFGDSSGTGSNSGAPQSTPTGTVPPPTSTPQTRSLNGKVVDAYSGLPVGGAEVTAAGILTATASDGVFSFDALPLDIKLGVEAEGYAPTEADPGKSSNVTIKIRPNTLSGRVTDASGKALAGVLVKLVLPPPPVTATATLTTGMEVTATTEMTSSVEATATVTTPTTDTFRLGKGLAAPLPQAGEVVTETEPITGTTGMTPTPTEILPTSTPLPPTATPTPKPVPPTGEGFVAVYTDENGSYFFKDVPLGATVTFKMPGYKLTRMEVGETAHKDVSLEVFKAQGIYLTAPVIATTEMFDELVQFIDESRVNAIVMNVQNDNSEWVFDAKNPDVIAAENIDPMLPNMPEIVKALKDKGIYTIARVVTFQQPTMAKARPDLAVKSSATGGVWIGGELSQQAWLDASIPAAQQHLLDMTKEVLSLGFDEIQYDYVRFPSDPAPGEKGKPVFSQTLTDTQKAEFIGQFLEKAHQVIEPSDAFMSIDIFGYTLWPDRNGKPMNGVIGQVFEYLVDHTDYICPMIYPSHFSPGEEDCNRPAACAYELVKKSGEYAQQRFAGKKAVYRPWLQAFDWYGVDYTSPGTTKVTDQMRAADETGAWGWMFWDPWNAYDPRPAFMK